jgi:CheY-like chemotaxis protein
LRSRVLVVDNDGDVLRGMQALLAGWDCEVLAAREGTEALRLARHAAPAMALLDYHLDGGDTGLRVLAALREAGIDCPAVIITADHSEPLRREVQAAGAHLLHKPLKPLALKSLMARLAAARAVDG